MNFLSFMLFWNLFLFNSNKAWSINYPSGIHFFREKTSVFPSGQIRREELEKKIETQDYETTYIISSKQNQKDQPVEFSIKADEIIRDLDLSVFVESRIENTPAFTEPRIGMNTQIFYKQNTLFKFIKKSGSWIYAQVQPQSTTSSTSTAAPSYWFLESHLKASSQDPGLFLSLGALHLKAQPSDAAPTLLDVPVKTRLVPLKEQDAWIFVQFNNAQGWVPVKGLAHKSDFALWAQFKNRSTKNWERILSRKALALELSDEKKESIFSIKNLITSPLLGIYIGNKSSTPMTPFSLLKIKERQDTIWVKSNLPNHGSVWWKKYSPVPEKENIEEVINTNDLLKREIFSADFDPKNKNKGIVSASGIFTTNDGEKWKKISRFKNENHPVSLHPQGYWIVGDLYSRDQGKNFEAFIRWDQITKVIEKHTQRSVPKLVIQDIKCSSNTEIKLTLFTGLEKIHLKGFINDENWILTK